VKQQEGLIEDGVANGAKSLGRKSGTEFNANFDPAASPFCKNVGRVTNLRRLSFRTMAARLPFMYVDKLHDKSTLCICLHLECCPKKKKKGSPQPSPL